MKGAKSELKDKKLFKPEFHSEVSEIQLHDNPIEIPIFTSSQADQDAFVNKIALKNSLSKIKASLMDMQRDLSILEAK